jgi:hypothetical protein
LDIVGRTFDINTIDGKRKYVTNAIKVISESPSPAEQEDLLKVVRDKTGTTFEALKRELFAVSTVSEPEKVEPTPEFTDNVGDKISVASRFVLASYLFNKDFAKEIDVTTIEFPLPMHKAIQQYIADKQKNGETPKFNDLYQYMCITSTEQLKRYCAEKFLEHLISEGEQKQLNRIGMLSPYIFVEYQNAHLSAMQKCKGFATFSAFTPAKVLEDFKNNYNLILGGNEEYKNKIKNMLV